MQANQPELVLHRFANNNDCFKAPIICRTPGSHPCGRTRLPACGLAPAYGSGRRHEAGSQQASSRATQPPWPGRQDESSRGMKVRAHHTGSQMLQQAEIDGLMLTCVETGTGEQNSINRAGATVHGAGQAKEPQPLPRRRYRPAQSSNHLCTTSPSLAFSLFFLSAKKKGGEL